MRYPALSAMRAFEATVRLGRMKHSARELNLTDGAVSRAIREVETDMGFALFARSNRLVFPTQTARNLADDIRDGLVRLSQAVERARRSGTPDRPLVISCKPTFLIRWLIPRLASLQAAIGPEREIRFVSAGGVVPFARESINLAIRRSDFEIAPDVITELFFREHVGPVCRPALADALRADRPIGGTLLHTATRPDAWRNWAELANIDLAPARELRFEHFYLSLQAAVAGAGVAIGPIALVADDIANGTLVAPHGFRPDGTDYLLMAPRSHDDAATFGSVLEWLKKTGGESLMHA